MALRALLLSADMRPLCSISAPLGVGDISSKTLVSPALGAAGGLSVMLGVTTGGTPLRHCTRARASFNGPTGFATKPILRVELFGDIVRSNREVCEQRTRTVGPFPIAEILWGRLATLGADSFDIMMFELCVGGTMRSPYHFTRKVVMESFRSFPDWRASGSWVFKSKPRSDAVWPKTLARRVVIESSAPSGREATDFGLAESGRRGISRSKGRVTLTSVERSVPCWRHLGSWDRGRKG